MIAEAMVGAGAGLVVGSLARKTARRSLARRFLVGSQRIARDVEAGRRRVEDEAPLAIRTAIREPVDQALARAGLDRSAARRLIQAIERLR